jgi:3-oxoadipate enol-lactonase
MSTQIVERMAVEIDGTGDPMVLIHGLGGTSNVWTPLMSTFA